MAKKMYLLIGEDKEVPICDLISVAEPHVVARYPTRAALDDAIGIIRGENLMEVSIKKGNRIILQFYDCVLESYQVHYEAGGEMAVYFYFRENAHGLAPDDEEDEEEEEE